MGHYAEKITLKVYCNFLLNSKATRHLTNNFWVVLPFSVSIDIK